MEPTPRTPLRTHGLRPLGLPRPVAVDVDEQGVPVRVDLGMAVGPRGKRRGARTSRSALLGTAADARWTGVLDVSEVWRIGEEWWRERPIRRTYFRVVVTDGRTVTVFRDELGAFGEGSGGWFEQRY